MCVMPTDYLDAGRDAFHRVPNFHPLSQKRWDDVEIVLTNLLLGNGHLFHGVGGVGVGVGPGSGVSPGRVA